MTVSTDSSAPLVAVVGATGTQGGSVVRNLIASDKPYRIRALTRDASKAAAQKFKEQGVEIYVVNLAVGNEDAVREAFKGANVVFGMTNFWEHMDPAREIAEGKLMADQAKAAGVGLFIFSGLPNVTKLSNGKYTKVVHFDDKAAVVDYARKQLPTVDVQAGFYMTNLADNNFAPAKQSDGTYIWAQPAPGDAPYPYLDIERDYGLFVRYAIESPEYNRGGGTIHSYGEQLTSKQVAALIEKLRGVKITITEPTAEERLAKYSAFGLPQHILEDILESRFGVELGYYFGQELSDEQQKIRAALPRKLGTLEEFLVAKPELFAA